jgi:hypothetical protein
MSNQPGKPGIAPLIPPDDEMPPRGIGFNDVPHDDEASELYEGFIQSPPPDDVLRDAVDGPFALDTSALAGPQVPASDRYVSVRDNQPLFDDLTKSLSRIRDEFARDHNKRQFDQQPAFLALRSEVFATLAQIDQGWVRKSQLVEGLQYALIAVLALGGGYSGFKEFVQDAAYVLDLLLKAIGAA